MIPKLKRQRLKAAMRWLRSECWILYKSNGTAEEVLWKSLLLSLAGGGEAPMMQMHQRVPRLPCPFRMLKIREIQVPLRY